MIKPGELRVECPGRVNWGPDSCGHAYYPSYSGGRAQEDLCSKSVGQIAPNTLSRKNPPQKKELVEWLKV
jgi:hypothetical protein